MPIRWICAAALLSLFLPLRADPTPDAREIVMKIAAQDKLLQQRRKAYDYDLAITREKLDDQNQATDTSHESLVVKGDRRPDFGTRTALGQPEDEAKKAAREEPFELLNILDHYTYTLEGEETVEGVPCYKIGFTPKPDMPYRNREEKVLNAVSGHLWASKADFSLMRNEGALMHPVSVAWVFATLREMNFHFETMQLPNGDYGPRQEQYSYLVSIPFWFTMHERDTRRMSNWRPAEN
jgi:hypothetical protein